MRKVEERGKCSRRCQPWPVKRQESLEPFIELVRDEKGLGASWSLRGNCLAGGRVYNDMVSAGQNLDGLTLIFSNYIHCGIIRVDRNRSAPL